MELMHLHEAEQTIAMVAASSEARAGAERRRAELLACLVRWEWKNRAAGIAMPRAFWPESRASLSDVQMMVAYVCDRYGVLEMAARDCGLGEIADFVARLRQMAQVSQAAVTKEFVQAVTAP
jgi:hypothetical protein